MPDEADMRERWRGGRLRSCGLKLMRCPCSRGHGLHDRHSHSPSTQRTARDLRSPETDKGRDPDVQSPRAPLPQIATEQTRRSAPARGNCTTTDDFGRLVPRRGQVVQQLALGRRPVAVAHLLGLRQRGHKFLVRAVKRVQESRRAETARGQQAHARGEHALAVEIEMVEVVLERAVQARDAVARVRVERAELETAEEERGMSARAAQRRRTTTIDQCEPRITRPVRIGTRLLKRSKKVSACLEAAQRTLSHGRIRRCEGDRRREGVVLPGHRQRNPRGGDRTCGSERSDWDGAGSDGHLRNQRGRPTSHAQ